MSKFIVEYIGFKDTITIKNIEGFEVRLFPNDQDIWVDRGDTTMPIDLKDFICIKNNNGVVLYTKEELESRVLLGKEQK